MNIPENTPKEIADCYYKIVESIKANTQPGLAFRQCDFDSLPDDSKESLRAWAKESGFNI